MPGSTYAHPLIKPLAACTLRPVTSVQANDTRAAIRFYHFVGFATKCQGAAVEGWPSRLEMGPRVSLNPE